ncbi:MAG: hypothetical protein KAK04_08060, partial [Cyclobacteriaceae bacterium]|nr:hypothetical protein [Cyclobacteriaceae bacterium]
MKQDKIKALLKKYYAVETSLEEEELLRQELNASNEVSEDLMADAELFAMMNALAEESTDQELDFENKHSKIVPIEQRKTLNSFSWTARIAAGFSLL